MTARVFLPAIVSGLLLWLAFFPMNLGPIAYIALVPLLTLVRAENVSSRRRYLAAFVGGLVFYSLALKWIRVAHPMMMLFAWPALTLYCALYWPLLIYLLRKLDSLKLPLALTFPLVWVALHFFRAHFPTGFTLLQALHLYQPIGFSWYYLGYSQHEFLPLIQVADLGGVYLIDIAVAAVNGAAYEWLVRSAWFRKLIAWPRRERSIGFTREFRITAAALLLLLGMVCYGAARLTHPKFADGPNVALLQGNVSQDAKMENDGDRTNLPPLVKEYLPLSQNAIREDSPRAPTEFVIWPETCYPIPWFDIAPDADAGTRQMVERYQQSFTEEYNQALPSVPTLLGLNRFEVHGPKSERRFNTALLMTPEGAAASYDKIHLVPFGEYVPLKEQLPWLQSFTPYTDDYSCTPGYRWTRFPLKTKRGEYHFGVLICYEDTDPTLARQYALKSDAGPRVDFLVNISNDAWFRGSEEHEEHLALCRFRAIEARCSVVRAVNMGISGVIDPDGRVIDLPGETWAESKRMKAIVRATVPLETSRGSLYALLGDWVPTLSGIAVIVGLVWAWRRRKV